MKTYNYWIPLIGLEESKFAVFSDSRTGVSMTIPYDHWVKIGRPGAIQVAPLPAAS